MTSSYSIASSSSTTSPSSSSASPTTTWVYVGCNVDSSSRSLSAATTSSSSMTPSACQAYCLNAGYPLAGTEYSDECYCGASLATNQTSTACTMACAGNSSLTCGGPYALSLYSYTGYIVPLTTTQMIGTYTYQGCYTDNVSGSGRSLKGYSFTNTMSMTEELCVNTCQSKGYSWAGMEYSQECESMGHG